MAKSTSSSAAVRTVPIRRRQRRRGPGAGIGRRRIGHLRHRRQRRRPRRRGVLAQPQLHVVLFELELSEVVLAHQFQDLLDFVDVH